MGVLEIVSIILGVLLLILGVALVALVLLQQGKDKKLSGAIAGGADTFYGKSKGAGKDKLLSKITVVVSILFVILVIAMYLIAGV